MAAQTAEQKAAADAAAADQKAQEEAAAKAAADAKAAEDKAAAEKAAADAAAKPAAKPAAKKKRYTVVGPIAVVRTTDGSERYLYRNAPVDPDAFDAESIKHLASLGLISEVK